LDAPPALAITGPGRYFPRMRVAILLLFLGLTVGCVTNGRSMNADIVPSQARQQLRVRLSMMIEKLLKGDDWTGRIDSRTNGGTQTVNADTSSSEDVSYLDVVCANRNNEPVALPVEDYGTLLTILRKRIRDLIEDEGGEQLDWNITENYHSRTLWFQYKQDSRFGWLTVVVARKNDGSDDLTTRFTVTVHEQPVR
jgi:hypothetical protein